MLLTLFWILLNSYGPGVDVGDVTTLILQVISQVCTVISYVCMVIGQVNAVIRSIICSIR